MCIYIYGKIHCLDCFLTMHLAATPQPLCSLANHLPNHGRFVPAQSCQIAKVITAKITNQRSEFYLCPNTNFDREGLFCFDQHFGDMKVLVIVQVPPQKDNEENRSKHTPTWNLHATCVKCRHTNDKLNCSQCRPRPMTHDDLPNIVRDAGSGRVSPTRIPATWVQQKTNHLLMLTTHKIDKHCQNCKHWSSCVCLSSCAWIQRHENNVGRWFGVETLMWPSFVKYELNASACG